jgi:hypothetical protein
MMRPAAALPVALVCILSACGGSGLCGNDLRRVVASPTGAREAIVFVRGCGATTGFSTQLSVVSKGQALDNEAGNTFVADGGRSEAAAIEIGIRWDGNDALVVRYPAKARTYVQATEVKGIRVRYETSE